MIHGTLDRLHLGDLLQWLQMGSLTGRLTLVRGRQVRHLDFFDGRVVFASSLVADERLATWLALERVIPAIQLRRLLGRALLSRTLFTDLVLSDSELDAEELGRCITRLAEKMMSRLLFAPSLEFKFDPAYPIRDLLNLDLNVEPQSLLMEAARQSDESDGGLDESDLNSLPATGAAFERFFWDLIRQGISGHDPVDGHELSELHAMVRDILATLEQWISSSPGLVPLPPSQRSTILDARERGIAVPLAGMPHACWNQMVLACSIRSPQLQVPHSMDELEKTAEELDLWHDMVREEAWQRPASGRLDQLSQEVSLTWSRAAAAAASRLKIDPGAAALAAHLLTMPTDFVLWVLTNVTLAHAELRKALLGELPRRLGIELARSADFSQELRDLFDGGQASALGACMHVSRLVLPSAEVWPRTLPESSEELDQVASARKLKKAMEAARKASAS